MPDSDLDPSGLLAALTDRLEAAHAAGESELLAKLLPVVADAVVRSLQAPELAGRDATASGDHLDRLAWIEQVRSALVTPVETAAVQARADGIRAGMAAGMPGSAFVTTTGLTLARIYQIRDGRR